MKTKLSSKGQVVLPSALRRKLGLEAGDSLDAKLQDGHVVLIPRKKRSGRGRIITDPITQLPVLTARSKGRRLTRKRVRELLDEFP